MPLPRKVWDRLRRRDEIIVQGRLATSLDALSQVDGTRLLNVGCKGGWLEREAKLPFMVGIDLEYPSAAQVHERKLAQASALALPFAGEAFDTVTMFEVLEHLPAGTEGEALAEIWRVLRPGGALLLSTPNRHPVATALDPAWWVAGHRHYREEALRDFFAEANFTITDSWLTGGLAEATYLPFFYVSLRLKLRIPFEDAWTRRIDREYRSPGWQTHFVIAEKR